MKRFISNLLLLCIATLQAAAQGFPHPQVQEDGTIGYLYAHVSEHGRWTAFAMSYDGIHFHDLLCGDAVLPEEVTSPSYNRGTVRDVYVCRRHDAPGYLMVTEDISGEITVRTSPDLVRWEKVAGEAFAVPAYADGKIAVTPALSVKRPAEMRVEELLSQPLAAEMFRPSQPVEGVYGPGPGSFLRITEEEYGRLQTWSDARDSFHMAANVHNPVFPGLFADPEALYSRKTGRFYIYPTTDGSYQWHNFDFHCFSSDDFITWKDEGVILDLRELEWGKEYAWAPCIIEKPVYKDSKGTVVKDYRYYYYFVADKSIGVAVADNPEGPFRDALGHPLLSQEDINSPGQVIDPDVFQDPKTGKCYLYWGNSYLWMAELSEDMVSLVPGTMHELIPRDRIAEYHYLEGTYVFERNGLYYFMWSENITRSPNYKVRYLISDSPVEFVRDGVPAHVEDLPVIELDPSRQIFGTGHNAVICMPDSDDWYIVYHRFTRPEGIKMGLSGGYNREICTDRMEFEQDGRIKQVKPSL